MTDLLWLCLSFLAIFTLGDLNPNVVHLKTNKHEKIDTKSFMIVFDSNTVNTHKTEVCSHLHFYSPFFLWAYFLFLFFFWKFSFAFLVFARPFIFNVKFTNFGLFFIKKEEINEMGKTLFFCKNIATFFYFFSWFFLKNTQQKQKS